MTENSEKFSAEKKKIIGLTGKYCAGKNYIGKLFEQRSIPVLDVDKLGHLVIEKERERLASRFGKDILSGDGKVDRRRLGEKVFGKPNELLALEGIIHPLVNTETLAWIDAQKEDTCVINAALLHKSSAFSILDAVIFVKAPFIVRLLRARKRDGLPFIALLKRLQSQREFKPLLFKSQFIKGKTDIYIVENTAFFGLRKPEKRIDDILSLIRITRV